MNSRSIFGFERRVLFYYDDFVRVKLDSSAFVLQNNFDALIQGLMFAEVHVPDGGVLLRGLRSSSARPRC